MSNREKLSKQKLKNEPASHHAELICCCFFEAFIVGGLWRWFLSTPSADDCAFSSSLFASPRQMADKRTRLFTVGRCAAAPAAIHSFYCHRLDSVTRCKFHLYAVESPGDSAQFSIDNFFIGKFIFFSGGKGKSGERR